VSAPLNPTSKPRDQRITLDPALREKVADAAYWEEFKLKEFVSWILWQYIRKREGERGKPYGRAPKAGLDATENDLQG
jgi:hypothetical protein